MIYYELLIDLNSFNSIVSSNITSLLPICCIGDFLNY